MKAKSCFSNEAIRATARAGLASAGSMWRGVPTSPRPKFGRKVFFFAGGDADDGRYFILSPGVQHWTATAFFQMAVLADPSA